MKSVLLIGVGRFGKHIAIKLRELRHEVMAVDIDETRITQVLPYVTKSQIGDAANEAFLRTLGVRDFDLCIVAIGDSFESSLVITATLKELGARFVVSLAGSDTHARFLQRNGADEIVYPERELAKWTAMRYSSDHVFDYMELNDDYAIFEVAVPKSFVGKTLQQLDIRKRYNVSVLATKTNGKLNPTVLPDVPLAEEETMLVLGQYRDIQKYFHV